MYNKTKWWGVLICNRLGLRGSLVFSSGLSTPVVRYNVLLIRLSVYYDNDDDDDGDDNDDDNNTPIPAHY